MPSAWTRSFQPAELEGIYPEVGWPLAPCYFCVAYFLLQDPTQSCWSACYLKAVYVRVILSGPNLVMSSCASFFPPCYGKWLSIRLSVLLSISTMFSPAHKIFRFVTACRWHGKKVVIRKPYPYFCAHATAHLMLCDFRFSKVEANRSLSEVYKVVVFIPTRNLSYTNICKCRWSVFHPVLVERMVAVAVMTLSELNNVFHCLFFFYIFSKLPLNTCQREYFSHFHCFTAARV